jgi:hypothetical protein
MAETPPRLRTKPGVAQKHREVDTSPEGVRRRRSTANRVLMILKALLKVSERRGLARGTGVPRKDRQEEAFGVLAQ